MSTEDTPAGDEFSIERIGRVALITLSRPHRKNALTAEMLDGLSSAVIGFGQDPDVGCVVITGAGGDFCSGADVKNMATRAAPTELGTEERTAQVIRRCGTSMHLHEMAKPTISVVDGVAAGAGMGLALSCDIRLASPRARFVTAFGRIALPGDFGITYFLARRCPAVAEELMFLSEPVGAERALALGLVNRIVPQERLLSDALALARTLADGPTETYAAMKRNLQAAASGAPAAAYVNEATATVAALKRPEHLAAAKAFAARSAAKSGA